MKFQALMVSVDDPAAEVLAKIFDELRLDHDRCAISDAASKFEDIRIDLLALNVDDAGTGENLIQALRRSSQSKTAVSLGLLSDPSQVAQAFGAGANFVLYNPISPENARATLRAATALLQRERRRQFRVPVQLPVTLSCEADPELEGIMLDLSEGGMDVLAAKALEPDQAIDVQFCLAPATDMKAHMRVVWANSNGQSGLQFIDFTQGEPSALASWLGTNAPQLPPDDPEPLSEYKLSDLSLGGCYIETLAPFPNSTRIDLCLRVDNFEIHLDGNVRIVYPGHGMGVEFAPTAQQRDRVSSLIDRLTSRAGAMPDVLVWPKGLNFKSTASHQEPTPKDEDPLLQLLSRESFLSQEEFVAELQRQRSSQPEVTTA